jgi:hypothetical protein
VTWWQDLIVALAATAGLYALAAWNLLAWLRRRIRERQAERLNREVWLDGPGGEQ